MQGFCLGRHGAFGNALQDRGALAKVVMVLLDHWKLSTEDQAALLGIASSYQAGLSNNRSGKPIGTSRDQSANRLGAAAQPASPGPGHGAGLLQPRPSGASQGRWHKISHHLM